MSKKLTQQQFIDLGNKKFNHKFDYSKVEYNGGNYKVTIICPIHGEFQQLPLTHLYTTTFGCSSCGYQQRKSNKLDTENFIKQAKESHGDKYDYSRVVYTKIHDKVEIICPEHGSFFQTPNAHISKRAGCLSCHGRTRHSTAQLISFMKENIIDQELNFSQTLYKNPTTNVIIECKKHGVFEKTPKEIFRHKSGCIRCEIEKRTINNLVGTDEFIRRAKEIHGDKYSYAHVVYERNNEKVNITCPTHGEFLQTPTAHIHNQQGCPICAREQAIGRNNGGYSKQWFVNNPEKAILPCIIYVIKMNCNTDNFIKIGITRRSIKERYQRTKSGDKYLYKEILATKYMSLFDAYQLEQKILQELKEYKYWPNYVFDGRTECFKNKPEVIQRIQSLVK